MVPGRSLEICKNKDVVCMAYQVKCMCVFLLNAKVAHLLRSDPDLYQSHLQDGYTPICTNHILRMGIS